MPKAKRYWHVRPGPVRESEACITINTGAHERSHHIDVGQAETLVKDLQSAIAKAKKARKELRNA